MKQKDILTIVQHNRGKWHGRAVERRSWGYFMNLGFKAAEGEFVCMLSDDCLVIPGAILNGISLFKDLLTQGEAIGSVAFYWRNWPEQKTYRVGLTLGNNMFVNHGIYLKAALEKVGYVSEDEFSFYHADGDLCLKMWQEGYKCVASPHSYIEHYSHANMRVRGMNMDPQGRDWKTYLRKWSGIYYHPEKMDIGDWIENDFADMTSTAAFFKRADAVNWLFKRNVTKVLTLLRQAK
jgi:glycosyltransferase involved in cell wall biosynthesis